MASAMTSAERGLEFLQNSGVDIELLATTMNAWEQAAKPVGSKTQQASIAQRLRRLREYLGTESKDLVAILDKYDDKALDEDQRQSSYFFRALGKVQLDVSEICTLGGKKPFKIQFRGRTGSGKSSTLGSLLGRHDVIVAGSKDKSLTRVPIWYKPAPETQDVLCRIVITFTPNFCETFSEMVTTYLSLRNLSSDLEEHLRPGQSNDSDEDNSDDNHTSNKEEPGTSSNQERIDSCYEMLRYMSQYTDNARLNEEKDNDDAFRMLEALNTQNELPNVATKVEKKVKQKIERHLRNASDNEKNFTYASRLETESDDEKPNIEISYTSLSKVFRTVLTPFVAGEKISGMFWPWVQDVEVCIQGTILDEGLRFLDVPGTTDPNVFCAERASDAAVDCDLTAEIIAISRNDDTYRERCKVAQARPNTIVVMTRSDVEMTAEAPESAADGIQWVELGRLFETVESAFLAVQNDEDYEEGDALGEMKTSILGSIKDRQRVESLHTRRKLLRKELQVVSTDASENNMFFLSNQIDDDRKLSPEDAGAKELQLWLISERRRRRDVYLGRTIDGKINELLALSQQLSYAGTAVNGGVVIKHSLYFIDQHLDRISGCFFDACLEYVRQLIRDTSGIVGQRFENSTKKVPITIKKSWADDSGTYDTVSQRVKKATIDKLEKSGTPISNVGRWIADALKDELLHKSFVNDLAHFLNQATRAFRDGMGNKIDKSVHDESGLTLPEMNGICIELNGAFKKTADEIAAQIHGCINAFFSDHKFTDSLSTFWMDIKKEEKKERLDKLHQAIILPLGLKAPYHSLRKGGLLEQDIKMEFRQAFDDGQTMKETIRGMSKLLELKGQEKKPSWWNDMVQEFTERVTKRSDEFNSMRGEFDFE